MSKSKTEMKEAVMKVASLDLPRADDDPRVKEAHTALKMAAKRRERLLEEYVAAAKRLKVLSNKLSNRLSAESVSADDMREAKKAKAEAAERCREANAAYDAALKAERNARRAVRNEIQKLVKDHYDAILDEFAAVVGPACSEFVEVIEELEQAARQALGPDPSVRGGGIGVSVFRLDRPARDPRSGASGVARVAEWAKARLGE